MRDPVLNLIPLRLREKTWLVFLIASIMNTLFSLLVGWGISNFYLHKGMVFCSIYEWRQLVTDVIGSSIVAPAFWATFVWQSEAIPRLFKYFLEENVVQEREEEIKEFLSQYLYLPVNNKRNLYIVIGGVILSLILFEISTPKDDPFLWGYPITWWQLNSVVYAIWLFNGALLMYLVWWIALRNIYFLRALRLFYRRFKLQPLILHPDGCNGLCEVGVYAIKITVILIIIGSWISFLIVFPFWAGKQGENTNNFGLDMVAMMASYLMMAPLSFWWPIWETHKAMAAAKKEKLQRVAAQIHQVIYGKPVTHQTQEEIKVLYDRYSFLEKNCRTWPVKTSLIGQFSFSMLLPLFSTLLSAWVEWYRS